MENQQQQTTLNLGEMLRQAREQLGLSLEQVAQKTLLKTAIIKQIENNQFIVPSCPPAFMKGYVRNYAKFLKIPEAIWNDSTIDYGEAVQNDLHKNMRNNRKVNHYSSYSSWIGRLTWLIALLMLGMTAYWWWQNYQQSQHERDNLVASHLNTQSESVNSEDVNNESAVNELLISPTEMTFASENTIVPRENSAENTESNHTALASALPVAENNAEQETIATVIATVEVASESAPLQTSGQVLSNVMQQLDGTNTEVSTEQSAVSEALPNNTNGLTIEIVGNSCWLSVRDGNRKVLAQKEYKQGEVLNFTESEAYSLVIGAPQNVRITFQGQEVPLTIDGRVARIKLPN